ncbi:nuclear transport factor 2 family protein [Spirosoma sp. RP8]|uniref:Nuclear transport factor 2 family protein n=1 Tax=Spirosoma liriopis TaxID=2937440 RepID=A0ABT0HH51_9BACT|nr:nuclear transport factor 2 family protein [Spirosoma liriopis]MCK8491492.1 nuclear transport factor 2 family protein [Spirosoma liriopis]
MKIVPLLLITFICGSAIAQTNPDESAVRVSVNQLFEGMKKADSTMLKTVFAPGARLQTVVNKQGNVSVQDEAIAQFISSVGKAKAGALDERLSGMEIKIDGELATAWTPYSFYYNGQQSHCGVNAFTLVKLAGTWKIQTIIDTRRKQNCP